MDVAQVRLGYAPQENIVRKDGKHSALLLVRKNGKVSTRNNVKAMPPQVKAGLPAGLQITPSTAPLATSSSKTTSSSTT